MTTTIEDLLPELLVEIFSHYVKSEGHLNFSRNVVPVCTAWWRHSSTPSLWRTIRVRNLDYFLSVSRRGLAFHTQALEILCADFPRPPNIKCLLSALPHIRDLKSLTINGVSISRNAMAVVAKNCPNLEHFRMTSVNLDGNELDPILTTCGPKLKHLNIIFCEIGDSERFVKEIAAKCTSLEALELITIDEFVFPIYKFMVGCPRLRQLSLLRCEIVTTGGNDCCGFEDLTTFMAISCDFNGLDVSSLLRGSKNLEYLLLGSSRNFSFRGVSDIPSDKVKTLKITLIDKEISLATVVQAVDKWKRTLLHLGIVGLGCSITSALKILLDIDSCPKLESLSIEEKSVNKDFLKIFIQRCPNLKELVFKKPDKHYRNREEIIQFVNLL